MNIRNTGYRIMSHKATDLIILRDARITVKIQESIDAEKRLMDERIRIEKQIQDIQVLDFFLRYFCKIRDEHLFSILESLPVGYNCAMICSATTEFLNKHFPAVYVKNVTDALSGTSSTGNRCSTCYISNNGGPTCPKHPSSEKVGQLNDNDMCSICMEKPHSIKVNSCHNFCQSCIYSWLITNSTCPICRNDVTHTEKLII